MNGKKQKQFTDDQAVKLATVFSAGILLFVNFCLPSLAIAAIAYYFFVR
jgi:hypothetical protein